MKKVLRSVSVLVLAGVVLVGCNKNSAKNVATTWLNDVYHADYDAAMPLSTDVTKTELAQLSQLASYVTDSSKIELKKLTVTIKDVKEKGDTAIATYVISDNAKTQNLVLVKQNGKWLVAFTKDDSFKTDDYAPNPSAGADSTGGAMPADSTMNMNDTAKNRD